MKNEDLLRETVRQVLYEIGPDVDYGGSFKDVFGGPTKDVLNVTRAELGKVSNKVKSTLVTVLGGLSTLLIPFVELDYNEVFKSYERENRKLVDEYAESYQNVDEIFKDRAWRTAFLFDPAATLTVIATRAPSLASKIAPAVASATKAALSSRQAYKEFVGSIAGNEELRNKIKNSYAALNENVAEAYLGLSSPILLESPRADVVVSFLQIPQVRDLLNNYPDAVKMRQEALNNLDSALDEIVNKTRDNLEVESIDDIEKKIGKELPIKNREDLSEEELDILQGEIIKKWKEALKTASIEMIESNLNAISLRPDEVAEVYEDAISEIKGL